MTVRTTCYRAFFLMTQVFFVHSAYAACNLEKLRFGSSPDFVQKQFPHALPMFGVPDMPRMVLMLPGEIVCEDEDEFLGAPVEYVFLYGELVEIYVTRLSDQPGLLYWAENIYGKRADKPQSLNRVEPYGQVMWDTFNSAVAYSYTSEGVDHIESIRIQSRRHENLFERYAKEEEEAIESGFWPVKQPSDRK